MESFPSSTVSSRFGSKESRACSNGLLPVLSARDSQIRHTDDTPRISRHTDDSSPKQSRLLLKPGSRDSDRGFETLGSGFFPMAGDQDLPNSFMEDRAIVKAGAVGAGWSKRRGSMGAYSNGTSPDSPLNVEPSTATDFANYAMSQLNQMYAFVEQAMSRERTRHSSDVQLLMRKVDKDLRQTFRGVRQTFASLTKQVQQLLREVDAGKRSIAAIQDKFDAAKSSAAIRAQYVEELEAVLDGQVPNISEAMRKLSEELTMARITNEKTLKECAEKEQAMTAERAQLRSVIRGLEERLNENDVGGPKGVTELPLLPEMTATWTLRQQRPHTSDASSFSPEQSQSLLHESSAATFDGDGSMGIDVLGNVVARSDATRGVTRMKSVRPLGARPATTPNTALGRQCSGHMTRAQQDALLAKVNHFQKRALEMEDRVARQHKIFVDIGPSLQLLRDIFNELRVNWRLKIGMPDNQKDVETMRKELAQTAKAPELLDSITQLFVSAFPQLGSFSEVLEELCEEVTKDTPELRNIAYKSESRRTSVFSSSANTEDDRSACSHLSPVLDVDEPPSRQESSTGDDTAGLPFVRQESDKSEIWGGSEGSEGNKEGSRRSSIEGTLNESGIIGNKELELKQIPGITQRTSGEQVGFEAAPWKTSSLGAPKTQRTSGEQLGFEAAPWKTSFGSAGSMGLKVKRPNPLDSFSED